MKKHLFWCLFLCFCLWAGVLQTALAQGKTEIVLLIDVSGSMKKNDPQNLRIPATNLLINLLKDKGILTILTFSTNPKLLMSTNEVNDKYANNFHYQKKRIDSSGQHTDILSALEAANKFWQGNGSKYIILLTDGKIDTGSAVKDSEDKKLISTQLIPKLQKNHVKLYTIGLGTDIDASLLNTLASQTNGIYQFISSIADIERSLYNVFTAAVSAQGVPLEKDSSGARKILIDKNITQLSIFINQKEEHAPISLYQPDGKPYESQRVNFNKFMFIDIKKPAAGVWTLKGEEQDIERALILTNLEFITTKLEGEYFNREQITITASLEPGQNNDQLSSLLTSTEVQFSLKNEKADFSTLIPLVNHELFKKEVILDLEPGITKSTITAKNNSFLRQNQSIFQVMPCPLKQELNNKSFTLELISPTIVRDSVTVNLVSVDEKLSVPLALNNGLWQISVDNLCKLQKSAEFTLNAKIDAKTVNGRAVTLILPEEKIVCQPTVALVSMIAPINLKNTVSEKNTVTPHEKNQLKKHLNEKQPNEKQSINLFYILGLGGLIILLVLSMFFFSKTQKAFKEKLDELGAK